MNSFYVPYSGRKPAAVLVNGHRLIILARDKAAFEEDLEAIGADSIKHLSSGPTLQEETVMLNKLARVSNAGVVVAPSDIHLRDIIHNLESQLPWLH